MAELYPRNIVPLKDDVVRILTQPRAMALYLTALDGPVAAADLARVTGRPRDEAYLLADELVQAGLLRPEKGEYVAGPRHLREDDMDAPDRVAFRLAMVSHAQAIVDEARHALRTRRDAARAGVGFVTLPDSPEVLARAVTILAEAEDQLRALAEEQPATSAEHRVRVLFFTGSTADGVTPS